MSIEWSQEMIEEFVNCRDDIKYFITKYVKIEINGQYKNIEQLTKAQESILTSYQNNVGTVFESNSEYDQSGKTTIGLAILLHRSIYSNNKTSAIMSPNKQMLDENIRTFKAMLEMLPPCFKHVMQSNRDLVRFENGNVVRFMVLKEHILRGMALDFIFFDEPAYSNQFSQEFLYSFLPTVTCLDSKIMFLSRETLKPSYWDRFVKNVLKNKHGSIRYIE